MCVLVCIQDFIFIAQFYKENKYKSLYLAMLVSVKNNKNCEHL